MPPRKAQSPHKEGSKMPCYSSRPATEHAQGAFLSRVSDDEWNWEWQAGPLHEHTGRRPSPRSTARIAKDAKTVCRPQRRPKFKLWLERRRACFVPHFKTPAFLKSNARANSINECLAYPVRIYIHVNNSEGVHFLTKHWPKLVEVVHFLLVLTRAGLAAVISFFSTLLNATLSNKELQIRGLQWGWGFGN